MLVFVEGPAGQALQVLFDDGAHGDGAAGDGIFGAFFAQTAYGGGYSVRILAGFKDPANPANTAVREWNGGFWIDGPRPDDAAVAAPTTRTTTACPTNGSGAAS